MVSTRLAPFCYELKSTVPGALCTVLLHLPWIPPILLVSVYAQSPRRSEIEKALNDLFSRYPRLVIGGDFNAQLSCLDTNGRTTNRWNWLSMLIKKKTAIDTFGTKHKNKLAYTRYKWALLQCNTQIGLLHVSTVLQSVPSWSLLDADILDCDCTSDHDPVTCTFRTPCTPVYPPPQSGHTCFRRLTQGE